MRRTTARFEGSLLVVASVAALGLSGCGIGTVAVGAAASGDDPSNADPVISDASVTDTRSSPATVSFRLTDAESDPVSVELLYQLANEPEQPMQLTGDTNLQNLTASHDGVVHTRYWNFEAQLPKGSGYQEGVTVTVRREGSPEGPSSTISGASFGNDLPEVVDPTPRLDGVPPEARGLVLVDMVIADSSGDVVELEVEFLGPDGPDDWQTATYSLGDSVPPIQATPTGRAFTFLWDSDVDGAEAEWTTMLRFTASDGTVSPEHVTTSLFAVDNNREPIASLGEPIDNPDRSGAIALSYQIIDEESDPTPVVFQWRRQGESFPDLPQSAVALQALLLDPEGRRLHHICTEAPAVFRGRVAEVPEGSDSDTRVRLPELASSGASLVAPGLDGRRVDILRNSSLLQPVKDSWSQDPDLRAPVATLPIADGLSALVLDGDGGSWNLRVIELATGRLVYTVVDAKDGAPLTMTWEVDQHSVLVASQSGTEWLLHRVELVSGTADLLLSSMNGDTEGGAVRGIVSLGSTAALLTVGSSLVRADYASALTTGATTLVDGLETPWGIVLDPLHRNRIYLAERDYDPGPPATGPVGRILAMEFDSYERPPVVAWELDGRGPDGSPGFPQPQALAIERSGARLLAVTARNGTNQAREVRAVDLGGERLGEVVELGSGLATHLGEMSGLSVGPEGLRLLTLQVGNDLVVGGGVLQSRTVIAFDPMEPDELPYDPATQVLTVSEPFDPRPEANDPWRIIASAPVASSSPTGVGDVFVWDSADVSGGGEVFLRVTPLGLTDLGTSSESAIHKVIDHPWVADPLVLDAGGAWPEAIAIEDLNGDGLLDLVCTNDLGGCPEGRLSIFYQTAPGVFPATPDRTLDTLVTNPNSVEVADLNGDGRQDIVCANGHCEDPNPDDDRLVIFLQDGTGDFVPGPVLGDGTTRDPTSVEVADLNGDGLLDLCSANAQGHSLTIFYQLKPGEFSELPDETLGDQDTTEAPRSVAAADLLNEDGLLDLVSANSESRTLTIFQQDESGMFGKIPEVILGGSAIPNDPCCVVAADLNGDGLLDLTTANQNGHDLVVFLQPASGYVSTAAYDLVLGDAGFASGPLFVEAADLNGDGRLDLISANGLSDNLHVYLQTASGDFPSTSPLILGSTLITFGPQSVRAADLNGDGRLDLVSANAGADELTVFFQTAPGDFAPEPDLTIGDANTIVGVASLAAADLDGDRLLDLVTADPGSDHLTVFRQVAPGVFSTTPNLVLGEDMLDDPWYVVIADVNGDGRVDLLSANSTGNNLALFFQTAKGDYALEPDLTIGGATSTNGPECVAAADLDNDGRFDLISANAEGDNLAVFLQDTGGTFPPTPDFLLGDPELTIRPVFVVASDLDGDGLGDLVSANKTSDNLAVFFQLPSGGFAADPDLVLGNVGTTNGPVGLAAADLNGDGLLDLVSANRAGEDLTIYFQTAPRQFSITPLILAGLDPPARPVSVSASDLNGDGKLDIVAADQHDQGNRLIAYLQIAPGIFNVTPRVAVGDETTTLTPRFLVVADLNGDGSPDLATANRATRTLSIFLNK